MTRLSMRALISIPLFLGISLPIHAQETQSPPTNDVEGEELLPLVKNPELLEYVQAPYPELQKKKDAKEPLPIEIDELAMYLTLKS